MDKENELILKCISILLSDPDGNNKQIRGALVEEIGKVLSPPEEETLQDKTEEVFGRRKWTVG